MKIYCRITDHKTQPTLLAILLSNTKRHSVSHLCNNHWYPFCLAASHYTALTAYSEETLTAEEREFSDMKLRKHEVDADMACSPDTTGFCINIGSAKNQETGSVNSGTVSYGIFY